MSYLYDAWGMKTGRLKYDIIDTIVNMRSLDFRDNVELRRVQALHGEKSLTIVLPKNFAVHLGIGKGDFLKCLVGGNRLIIEKMRT
jgi:hypothetical protein